MHKKLGPPLGIGGPGRRVSLPVSFSHRRVGSSILASLSEAGGNELRKVTSKPLPPRSPLFSTRHMKRAHGRLLMHERRQRRCDSRILASHSIADTWPILTRGDPAPKTASETALELLQKLNREPVLFSRSLYNSSRTPVTKFSVSAHYRFSSASLPILPHGPNSLALAGFACSGSSRCIPACISSW
jgi:hypothetical protein